MTLGAFAFIAAAAGTALAVQAPAAVTATDKSAIEKIVHDYILEHPEIIPQAIERLQAKRMSSTIADNRMALEKPYAGAWEGAANADVTVVEFFDYACGYCRASLPDLAKLVGSDAKVKIVYRELPILSEESSDAAKVSLLARPIYGLSQGALWRWQSDARHDRRGGGEGRHQQGGRGSGDGVEQI